MFRKISGHHTRWRLALASISALLLILLAAPAWSQEPPERERHQGRGRYGGPPDMDQVMERLTQDLELTEEQAAEVRPILEDQRQAMQALRDEFGPPGDEVDRDAMRERVREIAGEVDERLAQVLDETQMEQYRKIRHHQMRGRRHGGRGPRPDAP
jgi:hypothetical protein